MCTGRANYIYRSFDEKIHINQNEFIKADSLEIQTTQHFFDVIT